MKQTIRLMLVEDETLVSAAICALLTKEEHITLVGKADNVEAAVRKVRLLKPDVLLLDLDLPERSGAAVIAELMQHNPAVRILILAAYTADEEVVAALRAGAVGYVSKRQATTDLLRAIEHAAQGQAVIPPAVAHMMLCQINQASEQTAKFPLSTIEWRVLVLVAQGFANKEIARHLTLSPHTVTAHVSSILSKLNLANRTQAALYALKQGWVKLDELPAHSKHGATGTLIAPYLTLPANATGLQRPPR